MTPEWSHKIDFDKLSSKPVPFEISASKEECADLARRLQVSQISDLKATLTASLLPGSHVAYVSGPFEAKITQPCAVTADPVTQHISDSLEAWYSNEEEHVVSLRRAKREREGRRADAEMPIASEEEEPEPAINGQIDLGELVAQYLSLAIDPYPVCEAARRKEQANEAVGQLEARRHNPFAALKEWKDKKEK